MRKTLMMILMFLLPAGNAASSPEPADFIDMVSQDWRMAHDIHRLLFYETHHILYQ